MPRWIILAVLLLLTVAICARLSALSATLSASSGLKGRYAYPSAGVDRDREQVDAAISSAMRATRWQATEKPREIVWEGYLLVPVTAAYRFLIFSDGAVTLLLDGTTAAAAGMPSGSAARTLRRGLHAVRLDYTPSAAQSRLDMFQSPGAGSPFGAIPATYLVPKLIAPEEVRLRRWLVAAGRALPAVTVVGLALLIGAAGRFHERVRDMTRTAWGRGMLALLGGTVILFAVGSSWGLPAYGSWAPDELTPSDISDAWSRGLSHGWTSKYPPLHVAILAAISAPYQLFSRLGLTNLDDLSVLSDLVLISRATSVIMAVGTVWITGSIARDRFGCRAGFLAALTTVCALPFTYYGKTATLDVPYVFWIALSLWFYSRACLEGGSPRHFYGFVIAGAAAICTKDQAYGFFVLPAISIIVASWKAGRPPTPVLIKMSLVAIAAIAVFMNIPLNFSGVVAHVHLITGPNTQNYQMYPRTAAGLVHMITGAVSVMGGVMTWPLLVAAGVAAFAAVKERDPVLLMGLLSALSYALTFLGVVMYEYDRFFLGVVVALALATGWWLDRFIRAGAPQRGLRLAAVSLAFAYALSRCVALDLLMVRDSRYSAEEHLRAEAKPTDKVGGTGGRRYLPRPEIVPWTLVRANTQDLDAIRPDLLVVNVGFGLRASEGYSNDLVRNVLPAGVTYSLVGEYRSPVPFPLSLEPRFLRAEEDEFSNLTKINPLIRLYRRRTTGAP
jgi:hypothetical protein